MALILPSQLNAQVDKNETLEKVTQHVGHATICDRYSTYFLPLYLSLRCENSFHHSPFVTTKRTGNVAVPNAVVKFHLILHSLPMLIIPLRMT